MKSFKDLADQNEIIYGAFRAGSTYNFFSESTDPTIRKMYSTMARNPDFLIDNVEEGVDKVNNSRYAFIIETSFAQFLSGKYCYLTYIEDKLNPFPRQYAIALPKDSPHKQSFNNAIKKLKANGTLNRLKAKYWSNKCVDNQIYDQKNHNKATNIEWAHKGYDVSGFNHIYGVNKFLIILIILSIFKYVFM
jgi:ionotropic glutamate receptor